MTAGRDRETWLDVEDEISTTVHHEHFRLFGGCRCGEAGRLDCWQIADAVLALPALQQLAEALPFRVDQLFDGPHEYPTWQERLRTADRLLPVVERIAAERAAGALRAAAQDEEACGRRKVATESLRVRAEAMERQARP